MTKPLYFSDEVSTSSETQPKTENKVYTQLFQKVWKSILSVQTVMPKKAIEAARARGSGQNPNFCLM